MNIETATYVQELFKKFFNDIWLKLVSVFSYIAVYPFFDQDSKTALTALFFLIFVDMLTGIISSLRTGVVINSSRILRTALKISIYYTMISAGHLAELAGISFLPLSESLIALLAATELISILENCAIMGYIVPKKLLDKLKDFRDK